MPLSNSAPLALVPSLHWDGNDGSWSTFALQVGTPPQVVRVLPSTSGSSVWVVLPDGCIASDSKDCGDLRGFPFRPNASTTWQNKGLFQLPLLPESSLPYSGNARFGLDTVTFGWPGSGGPTLDRQVLAGFATKDFYIGNLGITPHPVNFTDFFNPQPSVLGSLRNKGTISSSSYGYTAGAYYKSKPTFGSLTFGGYDSARSSSNRLNVTLGPDTARDLLIGIDSITSGSENLLPRSIITYIDSTVAQIWLPVVACQRFEAAFGLVWNEDHNLYLVNDTLRDTLLARNASITFHLSAGASNSNATINITLPYASFDQTVTYPLAGNTTSRYFPLRRAQNESQYTLGRTFLQEAYLITDYDRSNFSISQALFPDPSVPASLIPIHPPSSTDASPAAPQKSPNIGRYVGIAIGSIVILAAIIYATVVLWRRWRRVSQNCENLEELPSDTCHEIPERHNVPELHSAVIHELDGGWAGAEVGNLDRDGERYKTEDVFEKG